MSSEQAHREQGYHTEVNPQDMENHSPQNKNTGWIRCCFGRVYPGEKVFLGGLAMVALGMFFIIGFGICLAYFASEKGACCEDGLPECTECPPKYSENTVLNCSGKCFGFRNEEKCWIQPDGKFKGKVVTTKDQDPSCCSHSQGCAKVSGGGTPGSADVSYCEEFNVEETQKCSRHEIELAVFRSFTILGILMFCGGPFLIYQAIFQTTYDSEEDAKGLRSRGMDMGSSDESGTGCESGSGSATQSQSESESESQCVRIGT